MAKCYVRYETKLSVAAAFTRVTDWERHRVPFTKVTVTEDGFTARTGLGPVGFDDPMEITSWDPPHRATLVKHGRVIRGDATIQVAASGSGSVVTWSEDARITGIPRWCDPVVRLMLRGMISLVLRRLFA